MEELRQLGQSGKISNIKSHLMLVKTFHFLSRNSDASETITSRKQFGDKTYETVTTRDRHGQSSSEEKLINITESELDQFKESFGRQTVNKGSFSPAYDPRNEMIQGPLQDSTFYRMWDKFFGK